MTVAVLQGDCRDVLRALPDGAFQCCVTSPPYFRLRSYLPEGHPDKSREIGQEATPEAFVAAMVSVFAEVRRVLRDDGLLWVNIGDSYAAGGKSGGGDQGARWEAAGAKTIGPRGGKWSPAPPGYKPKDLIGIPYMLAFALRADGWFWRSNIVWAKPNTMPGSQKDRCTSAHEAVLMFSKSARYYSDFDAIKTPPREASLMRLAQDVQAQAGSHRASGGGKTNGPMKAVAARTDKRRGHSRLHAGFSERWDAMPKAEQQATPAQMRDVWFVPPKGYKGAHFAVMPEEIARRCILASTREGDAVLDPFGGAGTTGLVADALGRNATLVELHPMYPEMLRERIKSAAPLLSVVA